ncbi:Hypothetical protein A7982_08234 [Minicystis rosea]|nr:Hypothetical protein A7982_08234 [Minicystis rosea]
MFSPSELFVLLDFDHTGTLSAFPTPEEIAAYLGPEASVSRSGATFVDVAGQPRFRAGLNHLYAPPRALLDANLWRCRLDLGDFPSGESATWTHLSEWMSSYLEDTLKREPKSKRRHGYRRYRGEGVMVDFAPTPPSQVDASQRGQIELQIMHDEPNLATVRRILRLREDVVLAGEGATIPSDWDFHLTATVVETEVRLRWSALLHGGLNDAQRCTTWMTFFLQDTFGFGTKNGAPEHATRWEAPGPAGRAGADVVLFNHTDGRRHTGEIRFPVGW